MREGGSPRTPSVYALSSVTSVTATPPASRIVFADASGSDANGR